MAGQGQEGAMRPAEALAALPWERAMFGMNMVQSGVDV